MQESQIDAGEVIKCEIVGCKCDACGRVYSSKKSLKAHKCTGHLPLQCGICMEIFKDRHEKYKHSLTHNNGDSAFTETTALREMPATIIPSQEMSQGDNAVLNNNNNVVTTNHGSINTNNNTNSISINVSVNDYANTDNQLVIDSIVKNPAFMQLADEKGLLTEAIIDETHFSGDPRNRNVFSIDKKGKYMSVLVGGERGVVNKKLALARSMSNKHQIVNSPEVKPLLVQRDEQSSTTSEFKRYNAERNKHENTFLNKGKYENKHTIIVPQHLPSTVADTEVKDIILNIMASIDTPVRQPTSLYKDVVLRAFATYAFVAGRWFKGRGEGWEVLKDLNAIQKDVHGLLNKIKNKIRQEIPTTFHTPDAVNQAKRILDYFPDKKIAEDAVIWLQEMNN